MSTGKVGLLVVLLSESVFFGTLLAAYASLRSAASAPFFQQAPGGLWFPLANLVILIGSLVPARLAVVRSQPGGPRAVRSWLSLTLLLGLVFVAGQVIEFTRTGMRVDDPAWGGVFFALMGFHALHILAGIFIVALNLLRARMKDFSRGDAEAIEIGSLFWYYIVAVWLVLFSALYLI